MHLTALLNSPVGLIQVPRTEVASAKLSLLCVRGALTRMRPLLNMRADCTPSNRFSTNEMHCCES